MTPGEIERTTSAAARRTALAGIVVAGLISRLIVIWTYSLWSGGGYGEHRQVALNLFAGQGFTFREFGTASPSAVVGPLFPMLLAGLYALFGTGSVLVPALLLGLNLLAACVAIVASSMLVFRWTRSDSAALFCAAFFALWPGQVYAAGVLQGLSIAIAGLLVLLLLLDRCLHRDSPGAWIAFCVIGAVLALLEPATGLVGLGLLVLYAVRPGVPAGVRVRNVAIGGLVAVAFVSPWLYRNFVVLGRPTLVVDTTWRDAWSGNGTGATGTDRLAKPAVGNAPARPLDRLTAREYDALTQTDEGGRVGLYREWSIQWVRDNPGAFARLCVIRLARLVWIDWLNPQSRALINLTGRTLLLPLSLIGIWVGLRRRYVIAPALVLGVAVIASTLFTMATARDSVLFEVAQLPLAAVAVGAFFGRRRRKQVASLARGTGVGVAAFEADRPEAATIGSASPLDSAVRVGR